MSGDKKSIDEEEGARFEKAMAPCRNCNHPKMTHSFLGMFKRVGKCVDSRLNITGQYMICSCVNFEPKDNLEFLEYKYETKKKRKGK